MDFEGLQLELSLITTVPKVYEKFLFMLSKPIQMHIEKYAGSMAKIVHELKAKGRLPESPTYVRKQIKRFITEAELIIVALNAMPSQFLEIKKDVPKRKGKENEHQNQNNETRKTKRNLPWQRK